MGILTGLTLVLLLPFLGKAFHMDDTVFLWCAEQILQDPLDFYGFSANWSNSQQPMYIINQNPPLIAYYIALVAAVSGWSEWALHSAFLLPAIALALGTYCVSRHFCASPLAAALLGLLTPAFVVSSTNVMAEITMTACYVWAAAAWLHGLESGRHAYLLLSAVLIGLSAMTKYFGITMTALLFVYSCLHKGAPRGWYLYFAIPVGVAVLYQWLTLTLYGSNLLAEATRYSIALGLSEQGSAARSTATGLSFLGGCMLAGALLTPWLWGPRAAALGFALAAAITVLLLLTIDSDAGLLAFTATPQTIVVLQYALFVALGIQTILLALTDLYRTRDNKSLMLFLWLAGTLVFSSLVNWSTNARTLLPLLPVTGILIVRRLEYRQLTPGIGHPGYMVSLCAAGVISVAVAFADFSWANNQQLAAHQLAKELRNYPQRVWFGGHWGFQWYMEKNGALPLQLDSPVQPGDLIIQPSINSNPIALSGEDFTLVEQKELPSCCGLRTMSPRSRAGFYSDYWGELPYAFGAPEKDVFKIFIAGRFESVDEAQEYFEYHKSAGGQASAGAAEKKQY